MRRPALLLCVLIAALACAAALARPATSAAALPAGRLPNLVELPPSDLVVVAGTPAQPGVPGTGRWALAFTSTAGNNGSGPLVVRSTRASAAAPWSSTQVVDLAGGRTLSAPLSISLAWDPLKGHEHFHIARFERYELVGASGILARDSKPGYCLGDRVRLGTAGAARQRFVSFCGRGAPAVRVLVQGISVGWADPYLASLPGQSFTLDGLPAGEYTLVNRVNDQGLYLEATSVDNVAATVFRLSWPAGPEGKPQVDVLRTCLAERCP